MREENGKDSSNRNRKSHILVVYRSALFGALADPRGIRMRDLRPALPGALGADWTSLLKSSN